MEKIALGLTEKIRMDGKEVVARIDTGAKRNSVCVELAAELKLGPIVGTHTIVSPNGREVRPVVEAKVETNKGFLETWYERIGEGTGLIKRAQLAEAITLSEEVLDVSTSRGTFWRFQQAREATHKYNVASLSDYFGVYLDRDLIRNPIFSCPN